MISQIVSNWWTFLIRGLCAIAFGLLVIIFPLLTILFFGWFIILDGALALGAAMLGYGKNNHKTPTWWLVLMGICGIVGGACALRYPLMTAEVIVIFIGSWSMISGIFALFGALDIPSGTSGKSMLIFNGAISILFGAMVFAWPGAGAISISCILGFYAIVIGGGLCAFSFRLKSSGSDIKVLCDEIQKRHA